MRIEWNYLIGFPGESDDELAEIAEEIESLHHLEPAAGGTVLRVDRFSPYFDSPEEFGLAPLKPHRSYRHVYPFPVESLMRIAYYFDSGLLEQKERSASARLAESMILRWQRSHRRSFLFTVPRRKSLMIVDTRRCARRWVHRLTGLRRAVYEHCDRAHRLPEIARALGESGSPEAIEAAVRSLVRDRLLLDSGGRFLSLGVDGGRSLAFDADPTGEYVPRAPRRLAANLLRAPLETMRRASSHLRQYRRRLRDRSTHRVVVALVRLFSESEPEREEAPRFAE